MAPVYTKPSIETGDFSESIWEGQIAVKQTHLRNCISALSDQAAVLATCVSVQVRGELGIGTNGRLDGDNNIAGEVGNSSHSLLRSLDLVLCSSVHCVPSLLRLYLVGVL
jgi:hypothetical protein